MRLEIVENPEPDPEIDARLDYLVKLSKIADTVAIYIWPAPENPCSEALDNGPRLC